VILGFLTSTYALVELARNTILRWPLGHVQKRILHQLNLAGTDFLIPCFQMIEGLKKLLTFSHPSLFPYSSPASTSLP
jgi:hypothetical protein